MTNYEKSIDFLQKLGTDKELFYNISISRSEMVLQGSLSNDSRKLAERFIELKLAKECDWLEGSELVDGLRYRFILTF